MKLLAIYNSTNKPFRKDGDEFQREAEAWASQQLDQSIAVPFPQVVDVRDGRIRAEILKTAKMFDGLDVLAIFDHGSPKGLPRMRESYKCVKGLAETIASVTSEITIILYACSCGKGWWWNKFRWLRWKKNKQDIIEDGNDYKPRNGYAIALCSELARLGVEAEVWAHLTWGHCCRLPHVAKIYPGSIHANGIRIRRARWCTPGTPEWKQWKADMKGPLRFTFWR